MLKIRAMLLLAGFAVFLVPGTTSSQQIKDSEIEINKELSLERSRISADISRRLRSAVENEERAFVAQLEGKDKVAEKEFLEAFNKYASVLRKDIDRDAKPNTELLVRLNPLQTTSSDDPESQGFTETWVPVVDFINDRLRNPDWPRKYLDRIGRRQSSDGTYLLNKALNNGDELALYRCARFCQFSEPGKRALRLSAQRALERGDSLLAVRWLREYAGAWPDDFRREGYLLAQMVRACREAGMRYELHQWLETVRMEAGDKTIDAGGRQQPLSEFLDALVKSDMPNERPELKPTGWLTYAGNSARNGIAPPIEDIGEMMDLQPTKEGVSPYELSNVQIQMSDDQQDEWGRYNRQSQPAVPVVYPVVHETGMFVHKLKAPEKLFWFRHGQESGPVELDIPANLRYKPKAQGRRGYSYYYGNNNTRRKYRVLGSTIGRVRWDVDNRESDILFAVIGAGSNTGQKGKKLGNQIQAFDLGTDASLRVTIPNEKVETEEEFARLSNVEFKGTPVIHDNKLYIAGAIPETSTVETWMFCFDVTPKGDPEKGEGKLLWQTMIAARKSNNRSYGYQPLNTPEISSVSMQGGLLYVASHSGSMACLDRTTGETMWISCYGRPWNGLTNGYFPGAPVVANGKVIVGPWDSDLLFVMDAINGNRAFEYPRFGKGQRNESEHILGVVDNRFILQGRNGIKCVQLTDYARDGRKHSRYGSLVWQADFDDRNPNGRGLIAGNRVLIPFVDHIAFYDLDSGKIVKRFQLEGLEGYDSSEAAPVSLTVYCRGEAYQDDDGVTRYHSVTVTDPDTGNVFNVEHLRNGDTYTMPSGKTATVQKETFLALASARRMYLFRCSDGGVETSKEKPDEEFKNPEESDNG